MKAWLIFTTFISTIFGLLGIFFGRKTSEPQRPPVDDEEILRRAVRLREILEEKLNETTEDTKALLEEHAPEQAVANEFNRRKE